MTPNNTEKTDRPGVNPEVFKVTLTDSWYKGSDIIHPYSADGVQIIYLTNKQVPLYLRLLIWLGFTVSAQGIKIRRLNKFYRKPWMIDFFNDPGYKKGDILKGSGYPVTVLKRIVLRGDRTDHVRFRYKVKYII